MPPILNGKAKQSPLPIAKTVPTLRLQQARVLDALAAEGSPALSRARLAEACGFTPLSGTVTRVLNGIHEGSSSGAAHAGILELGLASKIELDVDGLAETVYRITPLGREALSKWLETNELPQLKDRAAATNNRYKERDQDDA